MKTDTLPTPSSKSLLDAFSGLAHTSLIHFRLVLYAAVLQLLARVLERFETVDDAYERFPFLVEYTNELAGFGLQGSSLADATAWWNDALAVWEQAGPPDLPLRGLCRAAGLEDETLHLWITAGLIEEDVRFGAAFEMLHGLAGQPRPTLGLLQSWYSRNDETTSARRMLGHLQELGLLEPVNPEAPRLEWGMQVPAPIWDALRGTHEPSEQRLRLAGWLAYNSPQRLAALEQLILPDELAHRSALLPDLLAAGQVSAVIVRGPQHNGRHTLLGGLARALGKGTLEVQALVQNGLVVPRQPEPGRPVWEIIGPLATLWRAMPVISLDIPPGERAEIPLLPAYRGPIGLVLGPAGAVTGDLIESAITLNLEMPAPAQRRKYWAACSADIPSAELDALAGCFRLSGGNIRRAASLAHSIAALDKRAAFDLDTVRQASRALNRQALETLAHHLEPLGRDRSGWGLLAVDRHTQQELLTLESRCRFREQLPGSVAPALGQQMNTGVRALFSGPSGTGKTLAARLLAGVLQKDLYRIDLSAVVNKYIGETEKNLNQVFARAEELDVVLLLDEGDALLTQRTAVGTSNDRYANLETNYLLQRIESFQGILIVTTNAVGRIDNAFLRRMDIIVDFPAPEPAERHAIWQLHLPSTHTLPPDYLQQIAVRCILTGGQIRNAALHASLLAAQDGGVITAALLYAAVEREYRKLNAPCPLPRPGLVED